MVTEDYVSFETAKLLKERGFDINTLMVYGQNGNFMPDGAIEDTYQVFYPAPTLQRTMKWLREIHRLHVEVIPNSFSFEHQDVQDGWSCEVTHLSDLSYDDNYEFFQRKYSTYEEACEAAIKYCLENLI